MRPTPDDAPARRCISRDATLAAQRWPEWTWLQANLSRPRDLMRVLAGRKIAYDLELVADLVTGGGDG